MNKPKKTPCKGGVYRITCTVTGKSYIGHTSREFGIRWDKEHRYRLNRKEHDNRYLQNAWNKYGEEAFECYLLEPVQWCEDLIEAEQRWIDLYQAANPEYGFNICAIADRPPSLKGKKRDPASIAKTAAAHRGMKRSPETCARISEKKRGLKLTNEQRARLCGKKATPEARAKMSESRKGRKHSEETKLRMSQAKIGYKHSEESKQKMSASRQGTRINLTPEMIRKIAEKNRGKKRSAETRAKFSAMRKGKIPASVTIKKWQLTDPDGNEFVIENLNQFCKERGLNVGNMWNVANGRQKTCKGWKCEYAEN